MRDQGFRVGYLASPGRELAEIGETEQTMTWSIEMPRRISPFQDLLAIIRMVALLSKIKPAVVHAYTPKGGLLGMISATVCRVPVRVYHILGFPLATATGPKRHLLRASEWVSCRLAHEVLAVGFSMRDIAIQERLCPAHKIKVLENGSISGIDAENRFNPELLGDDTRSAIRSELGIPNDAKVIGYVGRIVKDKGIAELLDAWEQISERQTDVHLLLVGPMETQDPITEAQKIAIQHDPRVHHVGMIADVERFYAAMEILVLPTYREGFPNTPLEAAAMGLPVVATQIPGCVDAVKDGLTGTLVPARDADALAGAIRTYLNDPELRRIHGNAGRARVLADFTQEAIWEALYQEYSALLSAKGIPIPVAEAPPDAFSA
jgi:glycosyltransferase involved in cell wall biosynthesis